MSFTGLPGEGKAGTGVRGSSRLSGESPWRLSWRADPAARALADRHYNRQKIGADQFVPPGQCLVLKTADRSAVWVTSWPFAEYWPQVPRSGIVTFVDPDEVEDKDIPGWCYLRAGWSHVGSTKGGLWAYQQLPGRRISRRSKPMPGPDPVPGWQPALFGLEAS